MQLLVPGMPQGAGTDCAHGYPHFMWITAYWDKGSQPEDLLPRAPSNRTSPLGAFDRGGSWPPPTQTRRLKEMEAVIPNVLSVKLTDPVF